MVNEIQPVAYLTGGGEMGELTRSKDWTLTSLGAISSWPTTLRTTVSIILNSKFPMFLWWGSELIQFYNDAYRPSLGVEGKHPEALGQRGEECWKEIWPTIKPLIDQVMLNGESTWSEDQYIPIYRNGKLEDVYWTFGYSPVMDESEKPAGVLVTCTETTKTVQAIKKVQESENNLRNIIVNGPVAMCLLSGPSFTVEIANERMYELWGRSAEQLQNRPIFDGLPEANEQGFQEIMRHVYETGERFSANEVPVPLSRNGKIETVYINFIYEPFKNGAGETSGVMVAATDVSEQVLSRMKVEESNRAFTFVTDFMPQMIWGAKANGDHDYFNKQWFDYTGLSYAETMNTGWTSVIHRDDVQKTWAVWTHCLATGAPYEMQVRLKSLTGEYRWFLARALPLKDELGNILKWYGTCTDIDDRQKMKELMEERVKERTIELSKANEDLKRLNEELEQITYISHHDLQEPLRKITIFTDMVKVDGRATLSELSLMRLEKVGNAARRMSNSLRDVLDFSSLNNKEALSDVDLNELLALVVSDLELLITEKQAKLTGTKLPIIHAIPRQMQQLFYNLLSNALKFAHPNRKPVIDISCKKTQLSRPDDKFLEQKLRNYFEIIFRDNGIGFKPERAEKIFVMFQRLHTNKEFEGTGIGLAICKKVVTNHNGWIWAESKENEGACFKILIPA